MKYEAKRWTKPIQTSEIENSELIDLFDSPLEDHWRLKAKKLQARRWRKLRQKMS